MKPKTSATSLVTVPGPDAISALAPLPAVMSGPWREMAECIAQQHEAEYHERSGPRGMLGRPETIATFLQFVSEGLSPTQSAHRCGFSHSNVSDWQKRAETAPESSYGSFQRAIKVALEVWRQHLLGGIAKAGEKDAHWTALAWLAERSPQFGGDYKLAQEKAGGGVVIQIGIKDSELQLSFGDPSPSLAEPGGVTEP